MKTVLILGAAGPRLPQFQCFLPQNLDYPVVAFTATQIPDIAGRGYPAVLAGRLYPDRIPSCDEKDLESLVEDYSVDVVVFSYRDISHPNLMHLASRAGAAGADFWLLWPEHSQLRLPRTNVLMALARIVAIIVQWRVFSWMNAGFRSLPSVFVITT